MLKNCDAPWTWTIASPRGSADGPGVDRLSFLYRNSCGGAGPATATKSPERIVTSRSSWISTWLIALTGYCGAGNESCPELGAEEKTSPNPPKMVEVALFPPVS